MIEILIHKLLLLLFILSILNIISNIWLVMDTYRKSPENPIKHKISNKSLVLLGISISYFFTILFSGFLG